jgi:hypothetical protein
MQVAGELPERTVVRSVKLTGLPITPVFWNEALQENWDGGTKPDLYTGNESPNLFVRLRCWLTQDRTKEPFEFTFERPADIGWLDENGFGGSSTLEVSDVNYTNVVRQVPSEGFSKNEETVCTFEVNRNDSFNFNETGRYSVMMFRKTPFNEYNQSSLNNGLTYTSSWAKGTNNSTSGVSELAKDEFKFSTLQSDVINGGNGVRITVTHQPSNSSAQLINDGDEYIFVFSYWATGRKEAISVLVDIKPYSVFTDQDGLIDLVGGRLLDPDILPSTPPFDPQIPTVTLNDGYSNMECWNEDGLIAYYELRQFGGLNPLPTQILKLTHRLIANRNSAKNGTTDYSNPDNYILLQEKEIPFNIVGVDDGVPIYQNIENRGFNLADDDVFKQIRVRTFGQGVGFANIGVNIGFKVNWQYWNRFTENPFTTEYAFEIPMQVFDYGEDKYTRQGQTADFEGEITTEKLDGTDLGGNVLLTEDTVFRIEWKNIGGRALSGNFWFMHRIEEAEQPSFDIWELSTLRLPLNDCPLQPLSGEIALKTYPNGSGGYFSECRIDHTKLRAGVGYKLSGRIGENEQGVGFGFGYSIGFTTGFDA